MQIVMEKGEKKMRKRDSQVIWNGGALAGLGSHRPLHWAGSDGAVPRWEQTPGTGRDPAVAVGDPQGREHHPPEGSGGPGSCVPTQHLKPHPDLWEQPFGGKQKKKSCFLGFAYFLLAKGEWEGRSSSIHPSTPAVWLHLRAVTRRKKLRVPVGKSL